MLTITLGTHFPGMSFAQTGQFVPPDTIAAAGPRSVVELVNSNIAIYSKGGTRLFFDGLPTLFTGTATGNELVDPFVIYDELAGRFLVGGTDLTVDSLGNPVSTRLVLAVSSNNNPQAASDFSHQYSINMTEPGITFTGTTTIGDFPRIGWNADEYVITMNMFTNDVFDFDHVDIVAINRASLVNTNTLKFAKTARDTTNFTMAPATMHGSQPGDPMYFVEEAPVQNQIRVVKAANLLSTTPAFTETSIPVAPYGIPPDAFQQGTTDMVTTNFSDILNAEWRGNRLVASQTVGVAADNFSHARFYEFSTNGTPSLTQQATIGVGSGAFSYFPAIAIDPAGDLGMSFMQSSNSQFVSMYVTGQAASDPRNAMETPVLAQPGLASYEADFDVSPFRAGDYSGITNDIDPTTGQPVNAFWAANEFATNDVTDANWGTALANFSVAAAPDTTPPTISLVAPVGGEVWGALSTQKIRWTATDNIGVKSVDLLYSTNGMAGPFTTIATGLPNSGSFSWIVPNTPSANAIVEAVAHDAAGNIGKGFSPAPFTISSLPSVVTVTALSPNVLRAGHSMTVTITGTGFVNGASVTFVNGPGGLAPMAYNITAPTGTTIQCSVRVPITAKNGVWDLVVTNPNGVNGTLAGALRVVGGLGHPVGSIGSGQSGAGSGSSSAGAASSTLMPSLSSPPSGSSDQTPPAGALAFVFPQAATPSGPASPVDTSASALAKHDRAGSHTLSLPDLLG